MSDDSPRLVMTLSVSDEEPELVALHLEYHFARGVDQMIVSANRVPDETLAVLEPYAARGDVEVLVNEDTAYRQEMWITRMARRAALEFDADWVINSDVDEFYWPTIGTLKTILAAVPEEYGALQMPVFHFRPSSSDCGQLLPRMTVRDVVSLKPGGSGHLTKVCHRASPDISVDRGSHRILGGGDFPVVPGWQPIEVLHFPIRTYAQYERKAIKDGLAVQNHPDPETREGPARDRYERYKAGKLRDDYRQYARDENEVRAGIAAGELVHDYRLRNYVARLRAERPAEDESVVHGDALTETRADLARALYRHRHDALANDIRNLRRKLAQRDEKMAAAMATNQRLQEKLLKQQARWDKLVARHERLREESRRGVFRRARSTLAAMLGKRRARRA